MCEDRELDELMLLSPDDLAREDLLRQAFDYGAPLIGPEETKAMIVEIFCLDPAYLERVLA